MRLITSLLLLFGLAGCASGPARVSRTSRPEVLILRESISYVFPSDTTKPIYRYTLPAGRYRFYVRDGGTWIYLHEDGATVCREPLKAKAEEKRERPAGLVLWNDLELAMAASISPVADFLQDGMGELAWIAAKKKGDQRIYLYWCPIPPELYKKIEFEGDGPLK